MMIPRVHAILATLAISSLLPCAAQAYLSPEEVFGIELPEDTPVEMPAVPQDATVPSIDSTNAGIEDTAVTSDAENIDETTAPAAEEIAAPTARTFYRGGERVDVAEPEPNDMPTQPTAETFSPAAEGSDTAGSTTESPTTEAIDPMALVEALQEAEQQAEIATETGGIAEKPAATPEPTPSSSKSGMFAGIGGIEIVGIAAVLGALSLGVFALLKKKGIGFRAAMPKHQPETAVPPPPNEPSTTRLQEAIEGIKEEVSKEDGGSENAAPQQ